MAEAAAVVAASVVEMVIVVVVVFVVIVVVVFVWGEEVSVGSVVVMSTAESAVARAEERGLVVEAVVVESAMFPNLFSVCGRGVGESVLISMHQNKMEASKQMWKTCFSHAVNKVN